VSPTAFRWILPASLALLATGGCHRHLDVYFTRQLEARKLAADLRVQLHRSAEAVQRAIMAESDDDAQAYAQEARTASAALADDLRAIEPIAAQLELPEASAALAGFAKTFDRLQDLDRSLLELAVENSNVKAQRIEFGPAREAADAFAKSLEDAVRAAPPAEALRADLLAARAQLGVREIQALQAPHIAEAEDAVMTRYEQQMSASESAARAALDELSRRLAPAGRHDLDAAREQLDRFAQVNRELLSLSRQNTDVHSLAVALGEKRVNTANGDAALAALQDALSQDRFRATR
jgi:hypothetical protein